MTYEDRILHRPHKPIGETTMTRDDHSGDSKARRKTWLYSGIAAVVLIGGALAFFAMKSGADTKENDATAGDNAVASADGKNAGAEQVPQVSVIVPGRTAVQNIVTITGTLAARQEMPVGAEGEGGRIIALYADVGDRVGAGQILARLNADIIKPQVAQLAASLEEARASSELAKADFDRAKSVADTGAISREELDRRRATAATAAARVKVVAAQLNEAEARLSRTDVRAPAAGVVLLRRAELGQMASAGGEPLFHIARGGDVELRGQIAEQDLPRVRVGQEVDVRLTGVRETFKGKIWQLGAVIDSRTRQGSVRIDLPPSPMLRSGAFAQATISAGGGVSPILPQSAILADANSSYVFVVGNDGKIVRRNIRIGYATAEGVMVAGGLSGNEKIVATSAAFLREGEKVNPIIKKS
jgi:RND family efflux transporter MFP subunit